MWFGTEWTRVGMGSRQLRSGLIRVGDYIGTIKWTAITLELIKRIRERQCRRFWSWVEAK